MSAVAYNPPLDQMVFIHQDHKDTALINDLLKQGWQIASVIGSGAGDSEFCMIRFFVILERRRS